MKPKIFLSYAHTNAAMMTEFAKYLKIMSRIGKADLWTDGLLRAGTEWDPKIKAALEEANIIVILITVDAIISEYIEHVEMKRAYEKYVEGTARVICVIMEDCEWGEVPTGVKRPGSDDQFLLKHFQAVKPHGLAVYAAGQPSLATAMNEAYKQIDRSVDDFLRG